MKPPKPSRKLNRYTTLPVLLDLLTRKKLVLLDPNRWEDRSDAELIIEYKKIEHISKLFAICFCIGNETIHAWKAYAEGISGCCIQFDENKLIESLDGNRQIRYHDVMYCKTKKIYSNNIKLMPFIKRWPYRIEREFRILWEGDIQENRTEIEINLDSISRITVSQDMPTSIKSLIREICYTNPTIQVNSSTIFRNVKFIETVKKSISESTARR